MQLVARGCYLGRSIVFVWSQYDRGNVRITLCTPTFSLSLPPLFYQGSTLTLPIPLPILIVLVLHSSLMSCSSQRAWKGEELRIQKTQTITTRKIKKLIAKSGSTVHQCCWCCSKVSTKSYQILRKQPKFLEWQLW